MREDAMDSLARLSGTAFVAAGGMHVVNAVTPQPVDFTGIASIITAITGLLTAIASFYLAMRRRHKEEEFLLELLKRELREQGEGSLDEEA